MAEIFSPIVVENTYGHSFISASNGKEIHDSCLTCGAMYALRDRGDGTGKYETSGGFGPMYCTGDTQMEHGYEADSVCNCLLCF